MTSATGHILLAARTEAGHAAVAGHSASTHAPASLFESASFWLAVAFLVAFALVFRQVFSGVNTVMRLRAEKISNSLTEVRNLREDSKTLHTQKRKQLEEVDITTGEILEEARKESQRQKQRAKRHFEKEMAERRLDAQRHIRFLEERAREDIRNATILLSVKTTENLLREKMTPQDHNALIEAAIDEIPDILRDDEPPF